MFFFDKGLSREGEVLDFGVKENIIKKSGAWYTFPVSPDDPNPIKLGQGRDKARSFLEKDIQICQKVEQELRNRLLFKHNKGSQEEAVIEEDEEEVRLKEEENQDKVIEEKD